MTDFGHVGIYQFVCLILGLLIFSCVPILIAVIWKIKKKEPVVSIIIGAVTFFVFVFILEKPIQNVLAFPSALGLPENGLSTFLNKKPVLLALVAGLFPGVFEETGRLLAFKTILKKQKQRETSISYGIGHGGFEVMFLLGMNYINLIIYAVMINTGTFKTIVDQVVTVSPEQVSQLYQVAEAVTTFSAAMLALSIVERIFAVMFHIGASIIVFYACKNRKLFWLYPLAIALHTAMDFVAVLGSFNVINLPVWAIEAIFAAFGLLLFFGAYFVLYKKDIEVNLC